MKLQERENSVASQPESPSRARIVGFAVMLAVALGAVLVIPPLLFDRTTPSGVDAAESPFPKPSVRATPSSDPLFAVWASTSPWRNRLRGIRTHADSQRMIADLANSCGPGTRGSCKYPRIAGAPYFSPERAQFGATMYRVTARTPRYALRCTRFSCGIQGVGGESTRVIYGVPIPRGARPDPSTNAHMVLYDLERRLGWDLWRPHYDKRADRWTAQGAIRWDLDSDGVDAVGEPGSADGAGTPLIGTLLRPAEVKAAIENGSGVIPHALSGGFDAPRIGCFVGPYAKRTDARRGRPGSIPEGAVLQLDPRINLDRLPLTRAERVIARTLQVYGMVIRNDSGAFFLEAENVSAERPRARNLTTWEELGIRKDSLTDLQSSYFRVLAWAPSQAHGPGC